MDNPLYFKINTDNLIANTASVLRYSFTHPSNTTVLTLEDKAHTTNGERTSKEIVVTPYYKWVLIGVSLITLLAFLAYILMAIFWTNPTDMQKSAFDGASTAWKMGFGALVGLLGGKVS